MLSPPTSVTTELAALSSGQGNACTARIASTSASCDRDIADPTRLQGKTWVRGPEVNAVARRRVRRRTSSAPRRLPVRKAVCKLCDVDVVSSDVSIRNESPKRRSRCWRRMLENAIERESGKYSRTRTRILAFGSGAATQPNWDCGRRWRELREEFSSVALFNSLPSSVVSCSSKSGFTRALDRHFSSDKFSFGLSWPSFLSFFLLSFLFLFLFLLFSFLL